MWLKRRRKNSRTLYFILNSSLKFEIFEGTIVLISFSALAVIIIIAIVGGTMVFLPVSECNWIDYLLQFQRYNTAKNTAKREKIEAANKRQLIHLNV